MSKNNNFLQIYDEYLLYSKKEMKPQSYSTLVYDFNKDILPYFKNKKLNKITSKDILQWEEHILTLNYSNNYNRNLYYLLSGFLEYCRKFYNFDKTIISNVGCFKKKYEPNKKDFYTLKEFKTFIKAFDNIIYKEFFTLLFFTGLRCGEAMALRFSDIKNGYIVVDKTMSSHGKREIGTPKSKSSNRNVKIDIKLEKELLELKKYYIKKYNIDEDFYIFGGIKPISSTTANRYKKLACEKANIRPITIHQFRHSHATLLVNSNIPISEISRRIGHSKVSTTLDVYTHTDLSQEKKVYNTLNSLRFNFFDILPYFKKIISYIKTQH